MGGAETELKGPDLRDGVPIEDLPEGEPFLGHADGDAVVLVRRGVEVVAVGATCTHYGGPLSEGLVVGDTIRCPWHHACFSLRTGEALGAPALNPVASWDVEVRDGRARVTARTLREPLESGGPRPVGPERVVAIVGAGAAGSAAAEQLRREGHAGPVLLIDPDEAAPYDRPNLSKDYLAGTAPEEWIPLRPDGFYAEHGIERVVDRVEAVDADARTLRLSGGRTIGWDALLLATGATPARLPVPGADLPHVHYLRSLADSRRIISAAESAERAVVVGASFIGMEAAAALRSRGLQVTVAAPEEIPFERTLGAELGSRIRRVHEQNGVELRLGHTVSAIEERSVVLDDGTHLEGDLVVIGIGVSANTALAEEAGARVEDGVLVDEYLETTVPGVFAAGDIARWPAPVPEGRVRIEHWAVAQRLGQAAARSIAGRREPFRDVPFFWTRHFGLGVAYAGYGGPWSSVRVEDEGDDGELGVFYVAEDGRPRALGTIGLDLESLRFEAELEERAAASAGGASR